MIEKSRNAFVMACRIGPINWTDIQRPHKDRCTEEFTRPQRMCGHMSQPSVSRDMSSSLPTHKRLNGF